MDHDSALAAQAMLMRHSGAPLHDDGLSAMRRLLDVQVDALRGDDDDVPVENRPF